MSGETTHLLRCARCGTDHDVTWKPMTGQPMVVDSLTLEGVDGKVYRAKPATAVKWGLCPNTGSPVMQWADFELVSEGEPVAREAGG